MFSFALIFFEDFFPFFSFFSSFPRDEIEFFQNACVQNISKASELDKLLQPLHSSLFIESNPSPVKYAASLLGMCKPTVRLPLVEIREETKKKVSDALKVAKLL